jgi:hypothetical protein
VTHVEKLLHASSRNPVDLYYSFNEHAVAKLHKLLGLKESFSLLLAYGIFFTEYCNKLMIMRTQYVVQHYAISSLSDVNIFSSALCSQTSSIHVHQLGWEIKFHSPENHDGLLVCSSLRDIHFSNFYNNFLF